MYLITKNPQSEYLVQQMCFAYICFKGFQVETYKLSQYHIGSFEIHICIRLHVCIIYTYVFILNPCVDLKFKKEIQSPVAFALHTRRTCRVDNIYNKDNVHV